MKGIFSGLGIPERVIFDNQTCFTSEWDIESVTSSPHHSQVNGFSEAYVKVCKCIYIHNGKICKHRPFNRFVRI